MNIQGQHTFTVPRDTLWRALMDPITLAATLPGCDELVADGEGRFKGVLNVKIGPVQGRFAGTVQMADMVEPERFDVRVHGEGPAGFMNGEGQVRLDAAAGETTLHYDLAVHIGGRVASVGQRLLDSTARAIARQALEGLGRQIEVAPATSSAAPTPQASSPVSQPATVREGSARLNEAAQPPNPRPPQPSTTTFAAGVARDVLDDLVPRSRRRWLAAGLAAIVVLWIAWHYAL